MTSTYTTVGGLRIHYHFRDGDGPALVLLPGGMLDTSLLTWKETLRLLPDTYRLYCPDLPGYGRSDKPDDAPYTTAYFIEFLHGFLDALGLARAGVFGSSMSGAVALGFALQQPERVETLVLSGAYGFQPRLPLHELAYRVAQIPGLDVIARTVLRLHPFVVRLALPVAVHSLSRIDNEMVRDTYYGVRQARALTAFLRWVRDELQPHRVRTEYTAQLSALTMPVLLLHGAHDWMMPIRYARQAATLLPNAELHTFPGTGHLVPREWPFAAAAHIREFLAAVYGTPQAPAGTAEKEADKGTDVPYL